MHLKGSEKIGQNVSLELNLCAIFVNVFLFYLSIFVSVMKSQNSCPENKDGHKIFLNQNFTTRIYDKNFNASYYSIIKFL